MTFNNLLSSYENTLSKFFSGKYWLWKLVALTLVLTFVFYVLLNISPFMGRYKGLYLLIKGYTADQIEKMGHMTSYWDFMREQAANPFKQHHDLHPVDHKSNMAYRLLLPLVFKFTHLNLIGVFFMQLLLGVAQLFITAKIAFRLLQDKISTFYFTLAIAGIYFGNAFFYDVRGYGDPWVFALMTFAIFFRNPLLIFLCTQCIFWTDERGIVSISFVVLWWLMENQGDFNFMKALKNSRAMSIVASVVCYLIIRLSLESIYHLDLPSRALAGGQETGGAGLWVLSLTMGDLNSVFWRGYEAFILLLPIGFILLYKQKHYLYFALILLCFSLSLATTFIVYDTMRSISYTGIILFVFLALMSKNIEKQDLKHFLLLLAAINLLSPSFY